jgi:nucleotide-binding universal stress UspA family protein
MQKILIPTDFSEGARQAMKYGVALADEMGADLVFFHTAFALIPTSSSSAEYQKQVAITLAEKTELLRQEARLTFEALAINMDDRNCTFVVKFEESMLDVIEDVVKETQIDLVVMGTRGASGLKKLFIGSNTTGLMERVKCPVLAVPAGYEYHDVKTIAYATDLLHVHQEGLEAVKIAKMFDADLDIFHVYPVYPMQVNPEKFDKEAAAEKLRTETQFDRIKFHFVKVFVDNAIVEGINIYTETRQPDMLVMFTRKRTFFEKLLNSSTTKEVAFNVQLPLLSVKV